MAKEYLLVDGYNIIFAWEELREIAKESLEAARISLADTLCNYQGFKKDEVILVFDGHKSKGGLERIIQYNNIDIVYTKEAETADQFIEKVTQQVARKYNIRVATSDALEQLIILSKGAVRLSARELKEEIESINKVIKEEYLDKSEKRRNSLIDNLPKEMAQLLEEMRINKNK